MGRLDRLEKRLDKREKKHDRALDGRRRQLDLARELTRKGKDEQARGHEKQAAELGREARKHSKAIDKLERLIAEEKARQPKSGTGAWGGSKSIVVNECRPVAKRLGIPRTSSKRGIRHWATILNPGSDHSVLALTAFADDYGTTNGQALAHALADALGISGYSTGNYNSYYIVRAGKTFRVQILWAVEAHFDHVHVGIRRA